MGICYHCFQEIETGGACPRCGFDGDLAAKEYPQALPCGSILNGRYIIGRVLGQGGFGITYVAQEYQSGTRVAVKEFMPEGLATRILGDHMVRAYSGEETERFEQGKEQFLAEAEMLSGFMGSKNIVCVKKFFEENGTAYLVMEYIDGQGLNEYVAEKGGRLSVREADRLLLPVMDALSWVHSKGLVHRDISPDNILVTKEGSAKLIDFGAARYSTGEKSRSLDVILKHGFAPKEQYSRKSHQGPFTDVYGIAATYYYAITGKVPPDAISRLGGEDELVPPTSLNEGLSPEAEAVLLKALAVEYRDRYQTMAEFEAALEAENTKGDRIRQKKLRRLAAGLAAAVVAISLAAVFISGSGVKRAERQAEAAARQQAEAAAARQQAEAALPTPSPTASPIPTPTPEPGTFEYQLMLAEAGDPQIQYEVGMAYEMGEGVPQNSDKAGQWFKRASQQHPQAALQLGFKMYENPSSAAGAYDVFLRAAELGEPQGWCEAARVLMRSVGCSDSLGGSHYSDMRLDVEGDPYQLILEYLNRSWEEGCAKAAYILADIYAGDYSYYSETGAYTKDLIEEFPLDEQKAEEYRLAAAEAGSLDACRRLAGIGSDYWAKRYVELLTQAADAGDIEAMNDLGFFYNWKDSSASKRWYRQALELAAERANKGNRKLAYELGWAYLSYSAQDFGLREIQDFDEAKKWLELAASLGHSNASRLLNDWEDTINQYKHNS